MNLEPVILDLIIERSTYGLPPKDQRKLDQLIQSSDNPSVVAQEIERFELSLAALEVSQITATSADVTQADQSPLSPDLQERIRLQSVQALEVDATADNEDRAVQRAKTPSEKVGLNQRSAFNGIFVWAVAAASLLALAMFIRQSQSLEPQGSLVKGEISHPMGPSADLVEDIMHNDELMKKFLGSTPEDLLTLSWTPVDNKNVTGEVFWSDQKQTGFMSLKGLEVNDPQQKQYQVWIYDTDTKQRQPVNGGVFNVPKKGLYVVPIAPLSPVKKAVQFSITAEQPGGVDVSEQRNAPTVVSKPF